MKTRDGIKLGNILNIARALGIDIREAGGNHPYVLNFPNLRPCPLASSTDARRMVVPWIRHATGYENNRIYDSLRSGQW